MSKFPINPACGEAFTRLQNNLLRIKYFDYDNLPNQEVAKLAKVEYTTAGYHIRNALTKLRKDAITWTKEKQLEYCLGNENLYKELFEKTFRL